MLVLSRYLEESIYIGDTRVRVIGVSNVNGRPRVKLGIEAARDVVVLREELMGKVPPASQAEGPDGD